MPTFTLIYLLAISDNMRDTFNMLGRVCLFVAVVVFIGFHFVVGAVTANAAEDKKAPPDDITSDGIKVRKLTITLCWFTGILWTISAAFPSTENVLKAYAIVEGSKVINAENAELAAEAVGKRFDKFLDIVDRGINGRNETQKPVTEPKK